MNLRNRGGIHAHFQTTTAFATRNLRSTQIDFETRFFAVRLLVREFQPAAHTHTHTRTHVCDVIVMSDLKRFSRSTYYSTASGTDDNLLLNFFFFFLLLSETTSGLCKICWRPSEPRKCFAPHHPHPPSQGPNLKPGRNGLRLGRI